MCQAEDDFSSFVGRNGSNYGIGLCKAPKSYMVSFPTTWRCFLPNVVFLCLFVTSQWTNIWIYLILDPKRGVLGPWGRKAPSWEWSLQTCDGPRYRLTRNDCEKNLAENILRPGPGSRPIEPINNINTRMQTDRARQRRSPAWWLFTKVGSSAVASQATYLV